MRRVLAWGILGVLSAACCFAPPSQPASGGGGSADPWAVAAAPAAPGQPAAPPPPAVEVTACAVQDAYQANELAGQQQYPEGTHMIVTGTVDRIGQTFGTTIIHPRRCMFAMINLADDQATAAAALRPGQQFRADCTMGSFVLAASFDNCRLVQ